MDIWTFTPYDMNLMNSMRTTMGRLLLERSQYVRRDPYPHLSKEAWRSIDAMTEARYGKQFVEDRRADSVANQARLQAMVDRLDKEIAACQCQML